MSVRILVLNAGSSSLKASLIEPPDVTLARSEVDWGSDASRSGDRAAGLEAALRGLGPGLASSAPDGVDGVGYRVVHGGARFTDGAVIDSQVIEVIRSVSDLAPLHNDVALETIEAGRGRLPAVPHVACFDTAFHATLPAAAFRYPVPERWYRDWGIRRFGFHGLSVAWSAERAAELLDRPVTDVGVVVAHLGSGCSVTAVDGGRSVDTSMGLTPLEGLMMGTRSGSIDPGIILSLIDRERAPAEEIADALDHHSGLLGISGRTSDMRQLRDVADSGDERATLAIDMFVRRAAAGIASAATALSHLDAIVFSGGIGEHAVEVRRAIIERLGVLGCAPLPDGPDPDGDARIDGGAGSVAILRIESREDLVIAAKTARLLR